MWIARHGILQSGKYVIPPLDTFTGATVAYSVSRKLRTAYSGSAIRVRRSSDNTEQDIGYDSNGNLNESSLTSFVGSGNGFITTLYDNSTNGYNATQTTQSRQPKIVNAGSIYKLNGKPSLLFDGANSYLSMPVAVADAFEPSNQAFLWSVVYKLNNTANNQSLINMWDTANATLTNNDSINLTFVNDGLMYGVVRDFVTGSTVKSATVTNNSTNFSLVLYERKISTAAGILDINNTSGTSIDQTLPSLTLANAIIGALIRGSSLTIQNYLDGYISEIILYTTNFNRTDFKSNINSYYTIY